MFSKVCASFKFWRHFVLEFDTHVKECERLSDFGLGQVTVVKRLDWVTDQQAEWQAG